MNRGAILGVLVAVVIALAPSPARANEARAIAIVDTRVFAVSPVSGEAVTRQIYATVGRLGYRVVPESVTRGLASRVPAGEIPPPVLLRIAEDTHAASSVVATLGAQDGKYVVALTLANADRTGPFFARDQADAAALEATTDRLVRQLLPEVPTPDAAAKNDASAPRDEDLGLRGAIQTEGAFGLGRRFFYNHLLGGRLDYGFPGDFAIGWYLGYANLKGKEGRASNVLSYVQTEYRMHPSSGSRIRIPFRLGAGYLPKNGPFLRLSAGLSFPVGETTRLEFDLVTPTVWVVRNSTAYSMDVAAEVSFAF